MSDLEQRLDAVCESMELAKAEFEQATQCCVEAIQGMNRRVERLEIFLNENSTWNLTMKVKLERIEKWIESEKNLAAKS
jgi:hypothetical protein